MKITTVLKTTLLMIVLCLIPVTPLSPVLTAFASNSLVGSLDVFDGTHVSGWVHDESGSTSKEIEIMIQNADTAEVVKNISATPSYKRNDLIAQVGETAEPAFTVSVDMSSLPDGSYRAAAYKNGQAFTNSIYYTKGTASGSLNGSTLRPMGTFRLTAYCPCRSCSAGWGARTSSGTIAAAGHTVAVDKRLISMGSKLLINGTVYTAEDVGGAVKGNHIDIFFDSHSQATQFGVRSAEVYLIQ